MGAYENPPIITPPNYAQIFLQNFMSMYQFAKGIQDKKNADPGLQGRITETRQDTKTYQKESRAVAKGALNLEVKKLLRNGRQQINEAAGKYVRKEITWEEYNTAINQPMDMLAELSAFNNLFAKENEAYKTLLERGESLYQISPVGGLLNAYERGQIIPILNDDLRVEGVKYTMENEFGDDVTVNVGIEDIKKKGFFNVIESYISEMPELKESLKKIYAGKDRLAEVKDIETKNDGYSVTKRYQGFAEKGYNPSNSIFNSKELSVVYANDENAGSIYKDYHTLNWSDEQYKNLATELINEYKLEGNDAKVFREIVEAKQFSNVNGSGIGIKNELGVKGILSNWSKRKLSNEIASMGVQPIDGLVIDESFDNTTSSDDKKEVKLDELVNNTNEQFLNDPVALYNVHVIDTATDSSKNYGASYTQNVPKDSAIFLSDNIGNIQLKFPGETATSPDINETIDLLDQNSFDKFYSEIIENMPINDAAKQKLLDTENITNVYEQLVIKYKNQFK